MTLHRIRKGLDIPLAGAPAQVIDAARPATRVALLGADTLGLRPTLLVEPGARVVRGQPLYEDKKNPGVRHVAPATGAVAAIHRGERRAFQSLVVEVDAHADADPKLRQAFASWRGAPVHAFDRAAAVALLIESGLWTSLRERPFSHVPSPTAAPRSIFVTAVDSHPHAPDVGIVMAGHEQAFADGIALLAKLTDGPVYVCHGERSVPQVPADPRVRGVAFAGPHPSGTPGLHIHLLDPVDHTRRVWHIGYQDAIAIGKLVATGTLGASRVVSIAGPGALRPRLLRTRLGASLDELCAGETKPGAQRVISGSVLGGRTAMGEVDGYLGRYHQQVAIVPEATQREMFGYIMPGTDKFSVWNVVLGRFRRDLPLTTTTNGGARAMVPIGSYERVMPFDILPTFLLRALATKDLERGEQLGVLELDEEDLALATFVDPGKTEWGPLLRDMLEHLRKEEQEA